MPVVVQVGAAGGFCLHPDQVFLLSARDALLARLVLSGRAEGEERRAFMRKAFGKRWGRVRDEGEVREEAQDMLKVGSGHCHTFEPTLGGWVGGFGKRWERVRDEGEVWEEAQDVLKAVVFT